MIEYLEGEWVYIRSSKNFNEYLLEFPHSEKWGYDGPGLYLHTETTEESWEGGYEVVKLISEGSWQREIEDIKRKILIAENGLFEAKRDN